MGPTRRRLLVGLGGTLLPLAGPVGAQAARGVLNLSAVYSSDGAAIRSGLRWRVFHEAAEADGSRALVAESGEAAPALALPDGQFIVHVAFGLASATRRVVFTGQAANEKLALSAGALSVGPVLGDLPIVPAKLAISVFVPERGNLEAKLVVKNGVPNQPLRLPEGNYHIVSTYLDTIGTGSMSGVAVNPTNSIVSADIRVQSGKWTKVVLRHRAATMTLKLVNAPGGEALANSTFTVLTPGGDVIREMIGAFPSLVLAEGDYVVIARHDAKTHQANFKVESTLDRDVEVLVN